MKRDPTARRDPGWGAVAAWTALIYAGIPLARTIQNFAAAHWGRQVFVTVTVAAMATATLGTLLARRRAWRSALVLLAAGGFLAYFAARRVRTPEEALHFIEYGVLGALLFRALAPRMPDPAVYLCAAVLGSWIGLGDEALQWAMPGRFWDFRDVGLNTLAVVLVLAAIAGGLRPTRIHGPVALASWSRLWRWTAGYLACWTLCLLNTPARTDALAARIPGLGFLYQNESVMAEYGFRYEDPEIGVFFSRLAPAALARADQQQGAAAAAVLDRYRDHARYPDFLRDHRPGAHPLLYEARVHLFRRDHYWGLLDQCPAGAPQETRYATIALREYQILGRYFSNTLAHTACRLTPGQVQHLVRHLDPHLWYVSEVSDHLITRFSPVQLPLLTGALALGALAAGRRLGGGSPVPHA